VEMSQRLAAGLPFFRRERPAGIYVALGVVKEIGKILEHGRRIRACLKQPEGSPESTGEQVAILLALSADLFDPVPIDQMTDAEDAVRAASANIPADVIARLEMPEDC